VNQSSKDTWTSRKRRSGLNTHLPETLNAGDGGGPPEFHQRAQPHETGGIGEEECSDFVAGHDGDPISERNPANGWVCGRDGFARRAGEFGEMIGLPAGTRIWIVAGVTDLRRRLAPPQPSLAEAVGSC